jgi:D-alanine--poly(phosphoribitol) ligase subunit 1
MNILENVRRWSIQTPEHLAFCSSAGVITYRDLEQQSQILASRLNAFLPAGHTPLAVIGHKEPEMLVAFLAAVKSGHPYIPIDSSTPQQRSELIINTSGATLTLTPERVREWLGNATDTDAQGRPPAVQADDPWYIIYTSGSTGAPKGVVITSACLHSFVNWMLAEQGLREQQEVFINQAPFSFDLSVMDLYLSLVTGGTLYGITRDEIAEPRQLFSVLAGSKASVWVSTPSFAQLCLYEPTFSANMLPELRKFLFCGETLPPEAATDLISRFPKAEVWNTYGPTEATCATTSLHITPAILAAFNPLPVGVPKPDCHILVTRSDGSPCAEEERGEIIIAGPNVSPGYLGQPELTHKSFFEMDGQRAYHTGDLGHTQAGMVFFDGRLDNQIKLHGYRIELGDIEANLRALPAVVDAAVLPHLKDGHPDYLAAFVIPKEGPVQTNFERARAMKRAILQRLPAYMLPHKFFFMSQFPMTVNGKVDRRKLAENLQ